MTPSELSAIVNRPVRRVLLEEAGMIYFEDDDGKLWKHRLEPERDRPGRWRRKVEELARQFEGRRHR